eukprot:m.58911 g.58911  ORF g.58911 m.58911 type:complete len:362 (-) comp11291_c0_seq2:1681-2766(-)
MSMDDFDPDSIHLGSVHNTNNPLLQKSEVGRPKAISHVPNITFGVKSKGNDGGTAAVLGKNREKTPLESEATRRAKERNPLLRKAEVGRARQPDSEAVVSMVHGRKSVKEESVSDSISTWYTPSNDNTTPRRPSVGRARPPMDPHTAEIVHGIKHVKKDGGTAEVLSGWKTGPVSQPRQTNNPLLIKSEVGRSKHTLDDNILNNVWGKKSEDPKVKGGVSGALTSEQRPGTRDANKHRSQKLYKPELGRARPPLSHETETMTHGRKNIKKDGGTGEALSNWRPDSPKRAPKVHYNVDHNASFGEKKKVERDAINDLMKHSYGKKWLKERYEEQQQQQQQPQQQQQQQQKQQQQQQKTTKNI